MARYSWNIPQPEWVEGRLCVMGPVVNESESAVISRDGWCGEPNTVFFFVMVS